MFNGAESFNQDISNWNTVSVTNMHGMFNNAFSFTNQDLSGWSVDNVTDYDYFMADAGGGNSEPIW
jgi:surface protein